MIIREFARRVGLGRAAYLFFFRPFGQMRQSLRNGGPFAERETERHRREMEAAADTLLQLPTFLGSVPATLHLMTGRRFWYQTAFCLHSFARAARTTVHAELYDDGSIDDECAARLRRLGPDVRIHFHAELRQQRDRLLPNDRFPVLRERCENYPNIRKLIDVHLGTTGWKLVIDSDLLFFRRPNAMLDWLANPSCILHAIDCEESYGYSRGLLKRLAGKPLPSRLNVGICGLRSESIDWLELERWTAELHRREKTNYYLEQALVAMLAARQPSLALPEHDYVTMPGADEAMHPGAVMHHYVDTSKRWYFRYGWRQFFVAR
jgi:hypothetical protein